MLVRQEKQPPRQHMCPRTAAAVSVVARSRTRGGRDLWVARSLQTLSSCTSQPQNPSSLETNSHMMPAFGAQRAWVLGQTDARCACWHGRSTCSGFGTTCPAPEVPSLLQKLPAFLPCSKKIHTVLWVFGTGDEVPCFRMWLHSCALLWIWRSGACF